jgi:hypothetical protein
MARTLKIYFTSIGFFDLCRCAVDESGAGRLGPTA